MDTTKIMDDVYRLIDEIKKSPEYLNVKDAYDKLMSDEKASILIKEFNDLKIRFDKGEEVTKELSLKKKELYSNSLYKEYDKALIDYNKLAKDIEDKINKAIYKDNVRKIAESGCKND